jgi:hypothetical protein
LYDALVDFINVAVAIDCDHTQRLTSSNLLIFVEHPAIEGGALGFEPIFVLSGGSDSTLIAAARSLEREIKIRQQ